MISVKEYSKRRLGKLYFPNHSLDTARRKLLFEIAVRPDLANALKAVQPNPLAKRFSLAEVKLIKEYLGEPPLEQERIDPQNTFGL